MSSPVLPPVSETFKAFAEELGLRRGEFPPPPPPPAAGLRAMVREFHEAFGQPVLERPTVPSDERVLLRERLIGEEFLEWRWAAGLKSAPQVDMVEVADALGDLLYVVMGTALEFGINMGPVLAAIHDANMRKLGPDGKPILNEFGKVIKPDGWTPPDIAGVLKAQGWEP